MIDEKAKKGLLEIFSEDTDGSLPEITITFNKANQWRKAIYFVSDRCEIDQNTTLWSEVLQKDIECKDLPKKDFIKKLKVTNHFMVSNLYNMPDLGIFIDDDSLFLDFMTGKDWTLESIGGLINFCQDLKKEFDIKSFTLDDDGIRYGKETKDFFNSCFN